jgi:hypothetical protein
LYQDFNLLIYPRPADKIICAWTAMEKINRDNGCLVKNITLKDEKG